MTTSFKSAAGGTVCGNTARNRSIEPLDSPNASGLAAASGSLQITCYDHDELARLLGDVRRAHTLAEAGAAWVNEYRGCAYSADELEGLFDAIRDAVEAAHSGLACHLNELQRHADAARDQAMLQSTDVDAEAGHA